MARRIGGETVVKDGKILWGTLFSVLFGVPIYTVALEYQRTIALYTAGFTTAIENVTGWLARFVDISLSGPRLGFQFANASASRAVQGFGLAGFAVAVAVASVTVWIIIEGVTRVR
jgi:hypothetical protein